MTMQMEMPPDTLTDAETAALEDRHNHEMWERTCSSNKAARGGNYPHDWFARVNMSGFLKAKSDELRGGPRCEKRIPATPPTVTLRTGAIVPLQITVVVLQRLGALLDPPEGDDPCVRLSSGLAFYELVTKCRNPQHRFFGDLGEKLMDMGLVRRDGTVDSEFAKVVLAATEGDGMNLTLRDPRA